MRVAANSARGDIAVDDLESPMIQIHLRKSECDQEGHGADVISRKTGIMVFPVDAMSLLENKGSCPGSILHGQRGSNCPKRNGLPADQYAGHNLRLRAATWAALAGMEDSLIQTFGCLITPS